MKQQRGAALVVVLSMLAMSLMLGLSGMQSSQVDERLAGNYRSSVMAQMAAEAGASVAHEKLQEAISSNVFSMSSVTACGVGLSNRITYGEEDYQTSSRYNLSICGSGGYYNLVSTGNVYSGENIVSSRAVVVGAFELGVGFLGLSPITIPGSIKRPENNNDMCYSGQNGNAPSYCFRPPSSQSEFVGEELVDGVYNPAITVRDQSDRNKINEMIEGRESNYVGGVEYGMSESILESAADFKQFVDLLEACAKGQASGCAGGGYYAQGANGVDFGSKGSEKLAFYDGNFNGSGNFSGAGTLVIRGDASFSGTPSYSGLIIVLGTYTVSGGGSSAGQGGFNGSIISAPMGMGENGLEFFETSISISGGGGADYIYDAEALSTAFDILGEGARNYWNSNNDSTRKSGSLERDLSAWREVVDV
ncbi:PilX N-terminal domain-containing pilus assembly protein [Halomonas sp. A29]|uniref:pilus assembly PilX family protein n=1 Tax=Halomonas sp. A29 TaxID=3102786 RepID=UPI00398A69EC